MYDLLIQRGEVLDPGAGLHGLLDVAINRNRIVAVERGIPAEAAFRVVDARGLLVMPALIDLHTHIYHHVTYWGIDPAPVAARSGVGTWLDAGSAGAYTFAGLREFVTRQSALRLYALLNISAIGLVGITGELANLDYCDVALCERIINLNRDLIVGVKARIDRNTVAANGLEPLHRALQVAEACALPLMVHIALGPPAIEDVLALLRPGDILTHCCTGHSMRLVDDSGALLEIAQRAWDSGVIMDLGHGAGSFAFASAEAFGRAGRWPDVISSDIHQLSVHGPLFDLPTCMSKLLALGMPLEAVIRATTARPAEVLGMSGELGTLRPGALADVALFELQTGHFPLYDITMDMRVGTQLLRNALTIVNGQPLAPLLAPPPAPWIELNDDQRMLIARGHTPEQFAVQRRG
ncbi:MAG: amidohydrolase/deacetylase family metallohydrolase [Chloroflexi bacterium SZAS-1]|jgi:dihydroorotase|nr:amidohydrolase/deacetylase family metallohydrolase [Chloroflexi bacterium SZAS-1]HNP87355.1 amidohydrolase/deacetylase family metallohydrolase [Kouleothrix sp.]